MHRKIEDPYDVLGVDPSASDEAIKAAFKARAKELHPDINQGEDTTAAFQRIQAAYAILGNPQMRKLHDIGREFDTAEPSVIIVPEKKAGSGSNRIWVPFFVLFAVAAVAGGVFVFRYRSKAFSPAPAPASEQVQAIAQAPANAQPPSKPEPSQVATPPEPDSSGNASEKPRGLTVVLPTQAVTSEVPLQGRDGRTFFVSYIVAKQLAPARQQLTSKTLELKRRETSLNERRDGLERDRQSLNQTDGLAIYKFNERAEELKRDHSDFVRELEVHQQELDAYFSELERVALRSR